MPPLTSLRTKTPAFIGSILAIAALVLLLARGDAAPQVAKEPVVATVRAEPKLPAKAKSTRGDMRKTQVVPRRSSPAASHVSRANQERTALLIGINKAAGAPELSGAVADAKNVNTALLKYGFRSENIKMLLDGQATRPAILAELRSLAARTSPSGIAVFGLASHSSQSSFRTVEGARISAGELASYLGAVRGRMWNILSTCYAGGYAVPGVTGPGRVATFSSSSSEKTWEAGSAGTYIVRSMVVEGMTGGKAASSVEAAFNYARDKESSRAPLMRDGVAGNLALGPVTWAPETSSASKPQGSTPTRNSPSRPAPPAGQSCSGLACLLR